MDVLREQVRELRAEVERLRLVADRWVPRGTVVESQIVGILARIDRLEQEMEEAKLTDRELKTNWRLAIALGGMLGTFIVGIMLFVAAH